MKFLTVIVVITATFLAVISNSLAAPAENSSSSLRSGSDAKSAFGQPFDEIVVESTLNVKRKSVNRQSRDQPGEVGARRTKRQQGFPFNFPQFGGSAADASAQAQAHEANSPLGKFGASASGSQSQSLAFGPNGAAGSASFTGAQHYTLPNGQSFDVGFGNAVGGTGNTKAGGATIALNGPRQG